MWATRPHSTDYEGQFITVSVPFLWLRNNYPAAASALLGDAGVAMSGIGSSLPPEATSALAALGTAFGQLLTNNGSVNFFVGPTSPHSWGVSIGLGAGASFNGNSSAPSLAWSYFWQDWPRFDYPYDFRGN